MVVIKTKMAHALLKRNEIPVHMEIDGDRQAKFKILEALNVN
jgi:hypothetical protein